MKPLKNMRHSNAKSNAERQREFMERRRAEKQHTDQLVKDARVVHEQVFTQVSHGDTAAVRILGVDHFATLSKLANAIAAGEVKIVSSKTTTHSSKKAAGTK